MPGWILIPTVSTSCCEWLVIAPQISASVPSRARSATRRRGPNPFREISFLAVSHPSTIVAMRMVWATSKTGEILDLKTGAAINILFLRTKGTQLLFPRDKKQIISFTY